MQVRGGEGGEDGGAGPVRGNSVTSSLLQNKKRSECYRKKYFIAIEIHHKYFNRS